MTEIKRERVEYSMQSGKMKDFSFSIFNNRSKLFKQKENNIIAIEKIRVYFFNDSSYNIKRPLSMNDKNKTRFFRFFTLFLKI